MISIKNLTFGYSRKRVLYKDLNLSLENGSIYGLLGKNGAGKSTLLKIITGLLFPASGEIFVNGLNPKKRHPSFLQTIYFITDEVDVPPLTVKRYLKLFAIFYPSFDEKLFYTYLNDLEVNAAAKLTDLSLGQQKKFIIAFALACNTQLLIMDEPTNGLDIPSKSWFRKLIAASLNPDRIIIISSHQVRDLDHLIDKVIVVDNGELLVSTSMELINKKLSFKTVKNLNQQVEFIYAEESISGYSIVTKNLHNEDSKINLEHFFNAVTEQPKNLKAIFQN